MTPSDNELLAVIHMKRVLNSGDPTLPEFLEWVAHRLMKKGDEPEVDFVQALFRYANQLKDIKELLNG